MQSDEEAVNLEVGQIAKVINARLEIHKAIQSKSQKTRMTDTVVQNVGEDDR